MSVIDEIAAERQRQITEEGWTPDHDDMHDDGDMAAAASCYAIGASSPACHKEAVCLSEQGDCPQEWPWAESWWKPKSPRRDLIRAAALIVAEIERLDRSADRDKGDGAAPLSRDGEAERGWRPIETAPKDGTRILLIKVGWDTYEGRLGHTNYVWWGVIGYWSEEWGNWNDGVEPSGLADPTHWMPLPEPPTPDSAGREERSDDPSPKSTETMSSDVPNDGAETAN